MNENRYKTENGIIGWMASNPIAANILLLLVVIAGLFSLGPIRKEVFPSFPSETFTITVPYPGSAPEEVEQGIVLQIEEELRDLVGIEDIISEARESVAVITVNLYPGTDLNTVLNKAKVRVDSISSFPLDAEAPIIEEVVRRSPVMRISLYGNIDETSLKYFTEEVRSELLQLPDITQVSILGQRKDEISIELADDMLRHYGLDFNQVVSSIRSHSKDLPGGVLRTDDGVITLRSVSQAYSGSEYADIVLLTNSDGTRIKLGDIAKINDGFEEQPILGLFNGRRATTLIVERVGEQDVLQMAELLTNYIEEKRETLSGDLNIEGWFDRSKILEGRISLMTRNAMQGAVLVVIALALFLNLSLALWVIVGVPFAVLGTIATIHLLGLPASINVLSVFGFILVLGILVDDGIVTAESAYAQLEAEDKGVKSIVSGVKRVATPTIFGALTTVIAFAPGLFISEGFARIMGQLAIVVMLSVLFSLVETKLILPSHLRHIQINKPPRFKWLASFENLQAKASNGLKSFANGPYKRLLAQAVEYRYRTLAIFIAVLIVSVNLLPAGFVRVVFFPSVPSDQIRIQLDMPQGTAWTKTHEYALKIEAASMAMSKRFQDQDAHSRPAVNAIMVSSESDISAKIEMELLRSEDRDIDSVELAQWLREALGPLEGVRAMSVDSNAGPGGFALNVEFTGSDLESLQQAARELKVSLAQIKGVQDIRDSFNSGGRELNITVTPEGESLGLGSADLAQQVRQAFFGAEVQRFQRGREEVRVYLRFPESSRKNLETLNSMWITLPDGNKVPFSVVGKVHEQRGLSVIKRHGGQRVVNVLGDINKKVTTPGDVSKILTTDLLPGILAKYPDVNYILEGEAEDQRKTSNSLLVGLVVVLVLIYAALAIPLKSYVQPLLIMSVIPFGVIGAILGHLILGSDFSILSFIGVVGLTGVVVNDSLVIVDFINHYIDEGQDWKEAVMQAGPSRFRAVILTSLTTFLGLFPIQLESSIQAQFVKPMAISLGFGVLFATFVTLLLVPTLYFISKDIKGFFQSLRTEQATG